MADWEGTKIEAAVFNDLLAPLPKAAENDAAFPEGGLAGGAESAAAGEDGGLSAETLAVYADSYYAGTPALIRNRFGKGEAYYFGGAFAPDTAKVFLEKLGAAEPYGDMLCLPQGCELAVRSRDGIRWFFVLNFLPRPALIELKTEMRELWTGRSLRGVQELEAYGVGLYSIHVI